MTDLTRRAVDDSAQASRCLYGSSLGAVGLCIALWIRAKTIGEDERANAERRALFVGLWPPLLWLMADTLARLRREGRRGRRVTRRWLPGAPSRPRRR